MYQKWLILAVLYYRAPLTANQKEVRFVSRILLSIYMIATKREITNGHAGGESMRIEDDVGNQAALREG